MIHHVGAGAAPAYGNPELREVPVAVCGSVEDRHGIVLTADPVAKKTGIKTGMPVGLAQRCCPSLTIVDPHFDLYQAYCDSANEIYSDYSPNVQKFGIDESWFDCTGSEQLFGDGKQIADSVRARIYREMGVTVSIGVSFNKVFAKLASDLVKPNATTVIMENDYQQKVWPLPCSELLYVGPATTKKLNECGIDTIGHIANASPERLKRRLGKWGLTLHSFANGQDESIVPHTGYIQPIKSISNSYTFPHDLCTPEEIQVAVHVLADSVASRLRDAQYKCWTLQVEIRFDDFFGFQRQKTLPFATCTAKTIGNTALEIILQNRHNKPIRKICVRAQKLVVNAYQQLSLLPEVQEDMIQEDLERAVDRIRVKYNHFALRTGSELAHPKLSSIDPKGEHTIHPVAYTA